MNLTKCIVIEPQALDVIAQMTWDADGGPYFGFLPPVQLDRKLYEAVNKGLEALGGKWDRKQKAHVFRDDPREGIYDLLESGIVTVERDGFFPTPRAVIEQMVNILREPLLEPILEPSAGEGAIVDYLTELGYTDLILVEKNEKRRDKLIAKGYSLAGIPDFLAFERRFPTIVMNPPFEGMQDIDHITHAYENCLEPGGKLISVCGEGAFFRSGEKAEAFRDLVGMQGFSWRLPANSFKSSGTGVNARLVFLEKP